MNVSMKDLQIIVCGNLMAKIQGNTFLGHVIDSTVKEVWIIEGLAASGRKRLNHMWP